MWAPHLCCGKSAHLPGVVSMGFVHKPPRSAEQPGDAKPMVTKNIKVSETDNRPQDVVEKNSFIQ